MRVSGFGKPRDCWLFVHSRNASHGFPEPSGDTLLAEGTGDSTCSGYNTAIVFSAAPPPPPPRVKPGTLGDPGTHGFGV